MLLYKFKYWNYSLITSGRSVEKAYHTIRLRKLSSRNQFKTDGRIHRRTTGRTMPNATVPFERRVGGHKRDIYHVAQSLVFCALWCRLLFLCFVFFLLVIVLTVLGSRILIILYFLKTFLANYFQTNLPIYAIFYYTVMICLSYIKGNWLG